jgi:hypothetical protein
LAPAWAHVVEKVDAIDDLHGEVPLAVVAKELAKADEVSVLQVLERSELAFEAQECFSRDFTKRLESHAGLGFEVHGLVDDTHPAFAEAANDPEALGGFKLGAGHS